MDVDYSKKVSMPVRDLKRDGAVAFMVDVYGVTPEELCIVGEGYPMGRPMRKAITRIGLDPDRFFATIFDVPVGRARR